ncbi:MAG: hypothetical protein ABF539_11685 [Liquorilactobacillus nagelii]|uniref:hypothetical protein n=1 Tax=Liquorilactobacillus nagelii TaxID=82688 RepID=UPI0039E7E713
MFFRNNTIEFKTKEELEVYKSAVAETLQSDFGVRWDLKTAKTDDDRAFAMALACLSEFDINLVCDDEKVQKYLNDLQTRGANKEFI